MDQTRLTARDRQKLQTRARVVDAARALFAEKGYEQATIRDIAARAGVAPGSVFTTFQTKADLLLEIVFSRYLEIAEHLSAPAVGGADPITQLREFARRAYTVELQEPRLLAETIAASWTWSSLSEQENRRRMAPLIGLMERVLTAHLASTRPMPPADVMLLADMVFAIYLRNFRQALFDGAGPDELAARFERQLRLILPA